VTGSGRTVLQHAAALRRSRPEAFRSLEGHGPIDLPPVEGACTVLEDRGALAGWRAGRTGTVGVVPTMGALHEGQASLVRRARAECDAVLVTLFVNPLQFGDGEDLDRYPRTFHADCERLRTLGADAVYAPASEDLYPEDFSTSVVPAGPALGLEGERRPGHFEGVAPVVLKLWLRTRPDRAYFGRKDAQQAAVIRRMVRDLDLEGRVVVCPTVRERDGLALSSRNRYLSGAERARALALPRALEAMTYEAATPGATRKDLLDRGRARLEKAGLEVHYLEIVDPATLQAVALRDAPTLVVGAVGAGTTRLLDNRWLSTGTPVSDGGTP
jgi:pantoate--beta-alanine ligase